jgi:hypothetical protein
VSLCGDNDSPLPAMATSRFRSSLSFLSSLLSVGAATGAVTDAGTGAVSGDAVASDVFAALELLPA